MTLSEEVVRRALREGRLGDKAIPVHRGDDIFKGDAAGFPRTWDDYIGQETAKAQLRTHVASARARGSRLDHILLASGVAGIGKTTLAYLLAYEAGAGLGAVSGALGVEDIRNALLSLQDGDILFWDEFHLAVTGNKNRADFLLPFLQGGVLLTAKGEEQVPNVSVVAATTEAGKVPATILSRFMIRPAFAPYTTEQATKIVEHHARNMGIRLTGDSKASARIARAANNNPRLMRQILVAVRDLIHIGPVDLEVAFRWANTTHDGLSTDAQSMLLALLGCRNHTASTETLQGLLQEPGRLVEPERLLIQKGLLEVTGRGRRLTDDGLLRARQLAGEQRAA